MSGFNSQLLDVLEEIKGSGSFAFTDSKPFVFPGLEVAGVGEIGFPVSPVQVNEMIKAAHKAPFGKGSQTVLDPAVRSAWEIDASIITFNNSDWGKFVEGIIEQLKPSLGIEGHSVAANLYKLLIYEKGDFFLPHRDSEKEKGMFGTLIIGLPSKHTGGELTVKFDGKTEIIDFSGPSGQYKIPFAVFYADCEHEITPITSGYRVCLVYNLVQLKGKEKIQLHQLGSYANKLAAVLKASEEDQDIPKIVLLGHQYTPANFTMEALKLNDRPKAEALIRAAQKAGFYAKLGLVTSYQSGGLEMDQNYKPKRSRGRGRYYNDFDDDYDDEELAEGGVMGEVYDSHINIEHWMEGGPPPLRDIEIEEDHLISAIKINDGEPIEKEAEGYTGNAGMEMMYWYHYGAVFLWPQKYQYEMLTDLEAANKLEWITYYNKQRNTLNADENALIKRLAEEGINENSSQMGADYGPLVDWLINLKDEKYLIEKGLDFLTSYFGMIAVECWVKLLEAYPPACFEKVFIAAGKLGQVSAVKHLLAVLNQLNTANGYYRQFVTNQASQVPGYINMLELAGKDEKTLARDILENLLTLSKLMGTDIGWARKTTVALTKTLNRKYVNNVLAEVALKADKGLPLAGQVIAVCKDDLNRRVDNKPQPPADWTRSVPQSSNDFYNNKKVWGILTAFLQSPTQQIFDYQKLQAERVEMENAIGRVTIDLKMETIKKGSPHTLRLIKTQAAYEREMAKWNEDVELLKRVNDFDVSSS